MPLSTPGVLWLVGLAALLGGCKRDFVVHAGGASPAPAQARPTAPIVYTFAPPVTSALLAPAVLELMRDFNAGVGHDVLIIPPLSKPTSSLAWTDQATDLVEGTCAGKPVPGGAPAMTLEMSTPYAAPFFAKLGHLNATALYPAFARCIGLGLGLSQTLDPADVMGPDATHAKNFAPFFALIQKLTAARQPRDAG